MFRNLRVLSNGLRGRIKILNESINLAKFNDLVGKIGEFQMIDVHNYPKNKYYNQKCSVDYTLKFVNKIATISEKEYFNMSHEIFKGKFDEKHYIDLVRGPILENHRFKYRGSPEKQVSLEYFSKI
tara:strand:- start:457 stop:834 length:378 start_codon:yes stop_codon:yes gene_type:complete